MSIDAGHDGPLAEFSSLRQEIDELKRTQFQILALQLTAAGAVFGFVLSVASKSPLLLVLPVSSYLLCGRYVSEHFGTLLAAHYIRAELSPRVPGGLRWEAWLRSDHQFKHVLPRRALVSTLPLLLGFPGTGALALAWSFEPIYMPVDGIWNSGRGGLVAVWLVGLAATGISAWLLVRMALVPTLTSPDSAATVSRGLPSQVEATGVDRSGGVMTGEMTSGSAWSQNA